MKLHLSLPVSDIHATTTFYTEFFGEKPTKVKNDYVKFEPQNIPLNISFNKIDSARIDTNRHLGIQFSSQQALDDYYQRLKNKNLLNNAKTRETAICCYANQDKFWISDPNGYEWELYYLLNDSEQKQQASQCCQ